MEATLSFDEYDVYGFDIDHTLSKHDIPNLFDVGIYIQIKLNKR